MLDSFDLFGDVYPKLMCCETGWHLITDDIAKVHYGRYLDSHDPCSENITIFEAGRASILFQILYHISFLLVFWTTLTC